MKPRDLLHTLRTWGWPGLIALGSLVLSGGCVYATQVLNHKTGEAQRQITSLESRLRQAQAAPMPSPSTRSDWIVRLPQASQRQQRLADLLEISIHEGLNVTRTEHRLGRDPATGLERMRVTMPLQGGYTQIRNFISAALAHDPALSLDSLKLHRANPQATVLDAELVWSLHSRMAAEVS